MSLELQARITVAEPIEDLLAHAASYLTCVPHHPLVLEASQSSAIIIGPFPVSDVPGLVDPSRMYKPAFSSWPRGRIMVSSGRFADIALSVGYRARIDEVELGAYTPTAIDQVESDATAGYCVCLGISRNKASFALASLVICAVAERNGTRVLDEGNNLLRLGRLADPAALAAIFRRHGDATSFEEFADAFCREVNFAPGWPDAAARLDPSS